MRRRWFPAYDSGMAKQSIIKTKIQFFSGEEIAIGPGKADLLDAIAEHGSISAAGRALGMSYRRAWLLVDTMNRCWAERLVETVSGGGHERGARVTPAGQQILAAYRSVQAASARAAELAADSAFMALLRAEPVPQDSVKRS